MSRLRIMLALGLVLCIIDARDLQAGCCFVWKGYGWSACSSGVADQEACDDIRDNGKWDYCRYLVDEMCSCFGQWPYFIDTGGMALWRYVIVVDCFPEFDEDGNPIGDPREKHKFGMGWSNLNLPPPNL